MDEHLIKSSGIWSLGHSYKWHQIRTHKKLSLRVSMLKIKYKEEEHLRSLQQHIWPNSLGLASTRGMSP